jgi:hypothetical protein
MTTTVPASIRRTIAAVGVVAAVHVAALALIVTHRDVIAGALPAGADVGAAVQQMVIPHIVLAILLPLRALRLRGGRPRARIVLTIVLMIQIAAHLTLPMVLRELPGYGAWVIAIQGFSLIFEVSALVLLWSAGSRRFFSPAEPAPALAGVS